MNTENLIRGASVLGSCYVKRWLEGRYDQLGDLPAIAKLKSLSTGTKLGVEAILYALTAYAEQRLSDQSPLGFMAKTVLMDAAPEIAGRLMVDARKELTGVSNSTPPAEKPKPEVAKKLLTLKDKDLLATLIAIEDMDDATRVAFLTFAAAASEEEVAKFATLSGEQQKTILSVQGSGSPRPPSGWSDSFRVFAQDFWVILKAWSQKSRELALPVLSRYLQALLWLLKASASLWAFAFFACTASALFGRWTLFACLVLFTGLSAVGIKLAGGMKATWLAVACAVATAVMALLSLLAASGYADSVFGVAVLFLVGLPTLAIGALLIPATTALEILRSLFPDGYRTLMSAAQMLISALFGILIFSVVLLVFPPQNPVAFLFLIPAILVLAWAVGFGLMRTNPEVFLKPSVLFGIGLVFITTVGIMSMPNLRSALRALPKAVDRALVTTPRPVTFDSAKSIDFVTVEGEVTIWYAEQLEGGYDLFRCDGLGPYFTPDGRHLAKADSDAIRRKIGAWVDRVAAERNEANRKAEQERVTMEQQEQVAAEQHRKENIAIAEKERQALEKTRLEELARKDQSRRASYLTSATTPSKVGYMVCAASAGKDTLVEISSKVAKLLQDAGLTASNSVFSQAFTTTGAFEIFYEGKGGHDIQQMPLAEIGDKIFLIRCDEVSTKSSSTVSGLFTANIKMGFRILSAADGRVLDDFHLTGIGPGADQSSAESAAFERIYEQISKHKF